jgi:CheY-like chemotaxis protein
VPDAVIAADRHLQRNARRADMGQMKSTDDSLATRRDRIDDVSGFSAGSAGHPASSGKSRRPRGDPQRLQVMIVDDDATVLQLVKRIFESFGYRVAATNGSADAMADLSVKQFDLVVTDFEMPGMNGFRLAMWLKAESPATRVVIMTGCCRTEISRLMTSESVDGWIFKPFGLADMCNTLDRLGFPYPSHCAS